MKRWHALLPNRAILLLLSSIVMIYLISSYFGLLVLNNAVTLAIIALLLMVYFYKHPSMSTVFLTIFVLYLFGIVFKIFQDFTLSYKLSETCTIGVYALMLFILVGKLKKIRLDGIIWSYLMLLLLVNSYLLYQTLSSVTDNFQDSVSLTLTASRGVVLMIMTLVAFAVYLHRESSQSILFLTMLCCFVFSEALNFITSVHVHYWLFEGLQKICQAVGLMLLCVYVYNHEKKIRCSRLEKSNCHLQSRPIHVNIKR